MNRERLPCIQLNGQAIKSSELCHISRTFPMKCSIVWAKCVCKVTKDSAAMKALYYVLKDQKNPMIQDLINSWYERCYGDEMEILVGMVI